LRQKGCTGEQVDIGIKTQRQHERCALYRADLRKPVIARAPAERLAQCRLNRSREIQQISVRIGEHIGRKCEGQGERPLHHPSKRKDAHCHEPRRTNADDTHAKTDQNAEDCSIREISKQLGLNQMAKRALSGLKDRECDREHGQRNERGDGDCDAIKRFEPCLLAYGRRIWRSDGHWRVGIARTIGWQDGESAALRGFVNDPALSSPRAPPNSLK